MHSCGNICDYFESKYCKIIEFRKTTRKKTIQLQSLKQLIHFRPVKIILCNHFWLLFESTILSKSKIAHIHINASPYNNEQCTYVRLCVVRFGLVLVNFRNHFILSCIVPYVCLCAHNFDLSSVFEIIVKEAHSLRLQKLRKVFTYLIHFLFQEIHK